MFQEIEIVVPTRSENQKVQVDPGIWDQKVPESKVQVDPQIWDKKVPELKSTNRSLNVGEKSPRIKKYK